MSTRFYFDSVAAPTLAPPAAGAEWEHFNLSVTRRLNTTPQASAMTDRSVAYDGANHTADNDALCVQYVSAPLVAQTISAQTVKLAIRALETRAGNNLFVTWKIYLISSAGAIGSTILAIRRDATEVVTAVATNRTDSATSTSVSASNFDRIVIELGLGGAPDFATGPGHNGTIRLGDAAASDLPEDDVTQTDLRPWLEFANTLTFASMASRVTQDSMEVLWQNGETHLSQDSIEVLWDNGGTRLSQDALEVLYSDAIGGETRLSMDSFELLYSGSPDGGTAGSRLSQDALEILYDEVVPTTPKTLLSQDSIEVLYDEPVIVASTTTYTPDGQISSARGILGQITAPGSKDGQVTSAQSEKGEISNV